VERAIYQSEDPQEPIKEIVFDPFESPYRPRRHKDAASSLPKAGAKHFKEQVQDVEVALIRDALEQCQYNQRKTAKLLGLSYDQLRGYLRKYDKALN